MTCLRSAMLSSATFKNPTTKSLACQNISGNRMTYPCCDEGTPHTAGAHAQCLPTAFTALRWSNNRKNEFDQEDLALLPGYVVAASTLYSSCHAQRNYCEGLPH